MPTKNNRTLGELKARFWQKSFTYSLCCDEQIQETSAIMPSQGRHHKNAVFKSWTSLFVFLLCFLICIYNLFWPRLNHSRWSEITLCMIIVHLIWHIHAQTLSLLQKIRIIIWVSKHMWKLGLRTSRSLQVYTDLQV